jgi:proteic killer suppression protein
VIRSFRDAETKRLWLTGTSRRNPPPSLRRVALRKLQMLDSATRLEELRAVPGNRLEILKGDRDNQFSLRINDQYRLCFFWNDGDAFEVEIADYP